MVAGAQLIFVNYLKHAPTPNSFSLHFPAIFTGESGYRGRRWKLVLYEQSHAHVHPKPEINNIYHNLQ